MYNFLNEISLIKNKNTHNLILEQINTIKNTYTLILEHLITIKNKMNKIIAFLLFCLAFSTTTLAQQLDPVKWEFSYKKISETEVELIFSASIDGKWHLYSQFIGNEGPVPTTFTFEKNRKIKCIGKVEEKSEAIETIDKAFDMKLKYYEHQAVFTQRIKFKKKTIVKGNVQFMVCDDTQCLPPKTVSFEIKID